MYEDVAGALSRGCAGDGREPHVQPADRRQQPRSPLPLFTRATARQKVKMAKDAWNIRDPEKVALSYTRGGAAGEVQAGPV